MNPRNPATVQTSDFDYHLPPELIAKHPLSERSDSRLLVLPKTGTDWQETRVAQLGDWLKPGDLLVVNDSQVIKARLHLHKSTGGRVECLLERCLDAQTALAHLGSNHPLKTPQTLHLPNEEPVELIDREGPLFRIHFQRDLDAILDEFGAIPLPPYLERDPIPEDEERYQTVYAKYRGSVAAPTAGLHFTPELLDSLRAQGITIETLTLHVGAGTFKPVSTSRIEDHTMHQERFHISEALQRAWTQTRTQGGRIIAVGTTTCRAMESAFDTTTHQLKTGWHETQLFIQPGYPIRTLDALLTNFHLPQSTLLMLVSALAGQDRIRQAYQYAVEHRFRFYSYGDAMLIWKP